ncbi:MAG: hypothetical protein WCK32_00750 [Chlorobiaceae bacterium]
MFSSFTKQKLLGWFLCGAAYTPATTYWVKLHTGNPGPAGTANAIASGSGYLPVSGTFTLSGDDAQNTSAITFGAATAALGTVTYFSVWDASSGGNFIGSAELLAPFSYAVGIIPRFIAGALKMRIND